MDLALEAGISTRHLSFVETGRSRPSPEMVVHLAEQLEVPRASETSCCSQPYPAIAVDRHWNLVASNGALGPMLEGVAPELLVPPVNTIRLALHPDGVAPRIVNLGEYRAHLLHRIDRGARLTLTPSWHNCTRRCSATRGRRHRRAPRARARRSPSSCALPRRAGPTVGSWRSSARSRRSDRRRRHRLRAGGGGVVPR